ncbi:MAG TPA: DNA polymerase Y family protein [Roseiarcus sp.]|nr:DNA polymerase Y family protein [Roseiarcus sp.]
MMRRFLSLWLPRLATDRARRLSGVDKRAPLVAVAKIDNAQRLVSVDAQAARLGLSLGLSLPDARARFPHLIAVEAEPLEEARLLERLCDWCSRFTPLAGLDGRDGLMLDISGISHLFEGEAALIEDCRARLVSQGITVAIGAAGNPRAAWALARFSRTKIAPEPMSDKAFARLFFDLPLAALGLDEETVADMARAGLRRIGDIALRPRAPITARFGPAPVARLDALKGLERLSIAPRFPPPDFCAERRFASPIETIEAIEASLRKLAGDLVTLLERQARGARRIELALYRVDGHVRRISVRASRPLNEARAIVRLFAEKLASPHEDAIDAGYGVDLIRLACLTAEPLAPSQAELERAHEAERAHALAELLDRLSARLGTRAVTRRELVEAHLPDEAEAAAPATLAPFPLMRGSPRRVSSPLAGEDQGGGSRRPARLESGGAFDNLLGLRDPPPLPAPTRGGGCANAADFIEMQQALGRARMRGDEPEAITMDSPARPLRLFARPEPIEALAEVPDGPPFRFRWRRVLHNVAAIEGPERIAAPWWRGEAMPTRDYFRAEDTEGRRFWLYREGLWGRETARAKWFVHGLFG